MLTIKRDNILFQKVSGGNYSCPHFISPEVAQLIASSNSQQLDIEARKALAEVSENFALEILRLCQSSKPTADEIRDIVSSVDLR